MSSSDSLEVILQRLRDVRNILLRLHKALLESERVAYEQLHGQIKSKGEYFQLVLNDDWFNWLRSISQFIVEIDELLSSKEPIELDNASGLLEQAQNLMQPSEDGDTFGKRYYAAIQRDPDIALMHAQVSRLLET